MGGFIMSNYTADQIFDAWFFYIRENHDIRYIHRERPELVADLAYKFKKHNIDYDEAIMFTKKVVNKLTTEEGRKGNGKYKGWKECVEEDFKSALASEYVETEAKPEKESKTVYKPKNQKNIIKDDDLINAWLQHKFGDKYPNEIKELAHTVGSALNVEFLKYVFESDGIKKGNKTPEWLEKACFS